MIRKGQWHYLPLTSFYKVKESPGKSLKELLEGHDLIFRMIPKPVKNSNHPYHYKGQTVYKVSVSRVKENSLLGKILDSLHITPRLMLDEDFHSPIGMSKCFNEGYFTSLRNEFLRKK